MAKVEDLRIDGPISRPRHRGPSPTPWVLGVALLLFVWWMLGKPLPRTILPQSLQQAQTPTGGMTDPSLGGSSSESEANSTSVASSAPAGSFSAGGYIEVLPPGPRAVAPLFAGKVLKLHCAAGDAVQAGQLLAELDSKLLRQEAAVLQARVNLASSQLKLSLAGFRSEEQLSAQAAVDQEAAVVNSAQARLWRVKADVDRAEQLYSAGVMPRSGLDAALAELASAEAELGRAQAALESARAMLELKRSGQRREEIGISESSLAVARAELSRVQQQIELCQLKAPADGVVYAIYVPEGGWVDPGDGGEHRAAVLSLFDPAQLQAYADVNQRDSSRVSLGQPVELTTDARPAEPIKGRVERIMPQANLQRNTVRVIIAIEHAPDYLKPEMNVKVSFLDESGAKAASESGTPDQLPATAEGGEQ